MIITGNILFLFEKRHLKVILYLIINKGNGSKNNEKIHTLVCTVLKKK